MWKKCLAVGFAFILEPFSCTPGRSVRRGLLVVLSQNVPWKGTAADVFVQLQFPLHSGRILGMPRRIMKSLMGLIVAMLSVTGIVI